jgi:cytochrome c5
VALPVRSVAKSVSLLLAASLVSVMVACSGGDDGPPGQVELGSIIYERECQSCHGDVATGDGALPGAPVHGPRGHTWHHADGQLAEVILGSVGFPWKTMPPSKESSPGSR